VVPRGAYGVFYLHLAVVVFLLKSSKEKEKEKDREKKRNKSYKSTSYNCWHVYLFLIIMTVIGSWLGLNIIV